MLVAFNNIGFVASFICRLAVIAYFEEIKIKLLCIELYE